MVYCRYFGFIICWRQVVGNMRCIGCRVNKLCKVKISIYTSVCPVGLGLSIPTGMMYGSIFRSWLRALR